MINYKLYDLMGEDHEIEAKMLPGHQVSINIINDNGDTVYEDQTHLYAWESLVDFARQVLQQNEHIQQKLEDYDNCI